jgi:hypothetical protein
MRCFILGFLTPYKNQSAIARDFLRTVALWSKKKAAEKLDWLAPGFSKKNG